ncbi:MAG: hypothetical protein H0W02_19860 [Ktedonobacteraceae bacterium]|nr:hypothetical protein [Ktedonobacteraceae bacterium]
MPADAYQELLSQIQRLSFEEQLQLLKDLMDMLKGSLATKPSHSILELRGLGKEIWEGIDVDQYLEDERNSWNDLLSERR